MANLTARHVQMLQVESGLSPQVINDRGYRTIESSSELVALGFWESQAGVPGLLIPIHGPSGGVTAYSYRPDNPRVRRGKPVKYEWARGVSPRLDVPPSVQPYVDDPSVDFWITEGSKKADAAVSKGLHCLSIIGVWNFIGKNAKGGSMVIGDFDHVVWKGRRVYIAYDSDAQHKPSVRMALERLKGVLESRQAEVIIVCIPASGDSKVGLDDYLAAGGTIEALISGENRLPELEKEPAATLSTQMIELLESEGVDFWHDEMKAGYASFWVDDHVEHALIGGPAFGRFCSKLCFERFGRALGRAKIEVIEMLEAMALFEGKQHQVGIRVAAQDEYCYLFLADAEWRCVRISAEGWQVISSAECPIRFVNSGGLPLPMPVNGGALSDLRSILNVDDEDWELMKGFLIACFLPKGTFPILVVGGEQGSGKTFASGTARRVGDSVRSSSRRVPDEKDFLSAASHGHVLAFDNLSGVPPWLAGALCSAVTGTGFTTGNFTPLRRSSSFGLVDPSF